MKAIQYRNTLSTIVHKATNEIQAIPEEQMSKKPAENKWSKREILGHLIDSAYNNHRRFIKATTQDHLIFEGYDQDAWVNINNYQNRTTAEVIHLWRETNLNLCFMLPKLSDDLLLKKTTQHHFHTMCMQLLPVGEASNLAYLIWDYIFHQEYHLNQIIANYQMLHQPFEG